MYRKRICGCVQSLVSLATAGGPVGNPTKEQGEFLTDFRLKLISLGAFFVQELNATLHAGLVLHRSVTSSPPRSSIQQRRCHSILFLGRIRFASSAQQDASGLVCFSLPPAFFLLHLVWSVFGGRLDRVMQSACVQMHSWQRPSAQLAADPAEGAAVDLPASSLCGEASRRNRRDYVHGGRRRDLRHPARRPGTGPPARGGR